MPPPTTAGKRRFGIRFVPAPYFFQPPSSAKLRTLLPLYAFMTCTGTTSILFSLLPYHYILEFLPLHDS